MPETETLRDIATICQSHQYGNGFWMSAPESRKLYRSVRTWLELNPQIMETMVQQEIDNLSEESRDAILRYLLWIFMSAPNFEDLKNELRRRQPVVATPTL